MGTQQHHNIPTEEELRRRHIVQQQALLRREAIKVTSELDAAIQAAQRCTPQLFDSLTLEEKTRMWAQTMSVAELFEGILLDSVK